MLVKYKMLPADTRGYAWMQQFCAGSKCEFWAMRTGKTVLPFNVVESDIADRCAGNCQKSAMEFARWLSAQGLPLHHLVAEPRMPEPRTEEVKRCPIMKSHKPARRSRKMRTK